MLVLSRRFFRIRYVHVMSSRAGTKLARRFKYVVVGTNQEVDKVQEEEKVGYVVKLNAEKQMEGSEETEISDVESEFANLSELESSVRELGIVESEGDWDETT
jgi:hypothetical protein